MFTSEQLIQAVEGHSCLWNPHDDFYSSRQAKTEAWDQILGRLLQEYEGLNVEEQLIKRVEIKKRWNNIKDFYRKYCIKKLQRKTKSKYVYAKYLGFLDGVMDFKRLSKRLSGPNNDSITDNLDNSNEGSETTEDDVKNLVKSYTMEDNEKLLSLIEKHHSLWDRAAYCKTKRDEDLARIASKMEPKYSSFNETQQQSYRLALLSRWFNIRDSYKKNMKALASGRAVKPYVFFKHLEFLDPVYDYERNVTDDGNRGDDDGDDDNYGNDENNGNDDDDADSNDGESSEWPSKMFVDINNIEPKAKKMKLTKEFKEMRSSFASFVDTNSDEDMAFFKSILPDVKTLSKDAKMDFKIKVLKMLKSLQKKDDVLTPTVKVEDDSDGSD